MRNKRENLINRIASFVYHDNLDVAWCKAVDINELLSMQYINTEEEQKRISQALETINTTESRLKIRANFIKHLYYWLPEDSLYNEFQDANWLLDERNAYEGIVDKMILDSSVFVNAVQRINVDRLTGILLRAGIVDIYDATGDSITKEKVEQYLKSRGCDIKGRSTADFEDYEQLKKLFLEELFELDQVQFFIMEYSDSTVTFPAIIGIDNQTIGMLWIDN